MWKVGVVVKGVGEWVGMGDCAFCFIRTYPQSRPVSMVRRKVAKKVMIMTQPESGATRRACF